MPGSMRCLLTCMHAADSTQLRPNTVTVQCLWGRWQAALGTAEPPELLLLTQLLPRRWSAYLRSAPIDDVRRVSTRKAPTAPAPYAMP